jgi:replicative DNA helicase
MTPALHGLSLRLPPQNLPAEQALLGALLVRNDVHARLGPLRAEHFADPVHARIFATACAMIEGGRLADAVTLKNRLEHDGVLEEVGGTAYLAQLVTAMVSTHTAAEYAKQIVDAWLRRQVIDRIGLGVEAAFGDGEGADGRAILSGLQDDLFRLEESVRTGVSAEPRDMSDVMDAVMREHDEAVARGGGLSGLSWGYDTLDRRTGGMRPGELLILAGRPGMGKTALGAGVAYRAAHRGARVLFVSCEMRPEGVGARVLAALAGLPLGAVLDGVIIEPGANQFRRLDTDEYGRLIEAKRTAAALPVQMLRAGSPTIGTIRAAAQRQASRGGLDLIVIDYLGLLRPPVGMSPGTPKAVEIAEITRAAKLMAMDLGVPVLMLAQINREAAKRDDKIPQLTDLRDSGAIEQDADVVAFIHRPEYYLSKPIERAPGESDDKFLAREAARMDQLRGAAGRAMVLLAKQRQGAGGVCDLRFSARTTWFHEEHEDAALPL